MAKRKSISMKTLTGAIKSASREIGFDGVGIAPAAVPPQDGLHLRQWLGRGYQASMKWMDEGLTQRLDPRLVVPGARSVIAVAMNYYTPWRHTEERGFGKLSRYAWGVDYHEILKSRIQSLLERITQLAPDSGGRCYVDTGPIMEKLWAERAGLGWRGKHSNLISRRFGSWMFLGEIVTTLELDYDTPGEDLCGSCTACIDACPTRAIVEPYVVDSNRCISYLTIEHRNEIDPALQPLFKGWIYGCDICQDVCPWNRFQKPTAVAEFAPRDGETALNLETIGAMSQEEFSARFRKSPVKRTKRDGLQRNAKVLTGHQDI